MKNSRAHCSKTVVMSANTSWNIVNFRMGLLRALSEAGYRPVVLAPRDPYSQRIIDEGYEYHPMEMSRSGSNIFKELRVILDCYRLLRKCDADCFLSFTIKPNIYGSIAARMAGVGSIINNVSGLGVLFFQRRWMSSFLLAFYRFALSRSKVVFFQNPDDRALLLERRVVTSGQARLVPGSGVDLERFRPGPDAHRRVATTEVRFLFIGRLLHSKGIGELVRAAKQMKGSLPTIRCQILGEVDPGNRTGVRPQELQGWIDQGVVDYLGHTDDVRPYIEQADVVVLPSYYGEGVPRSLLEAAAMAKPLIAADVPGSREIVEDGVTGALCRPRDVASLAAALGRLASMPSADRDRLGAAARQRVEERFSEAIVVKAYLEALSQEGGQVS